MSGPKRVLNMDVPKAAEKEIRLLYQAINDIDQKVTEQIPATIANGAVENSLRYDSIGM